MNNKKKSKDGGKNVYPKVKNTEVKLELADNIIWEIRKKEQEVASNV